MSTDRMPMPDPAELDEAGRAAVEAVTNGPRGSLFGPFVPLLRSPGLMARLQEVGSFLRFGSTLDRAVFELAILQVARHRDQEFEWNYHSPLALRAGVPEAAVRAVAAGREPQDLPEPLATGHELVAVLLRHDEVDDELYARALGIFGPAGLIDLVVTVGYYTTLAMVMNTTRTDASGLPVEIPLEPR